MQKVALIIGLIALPNAAVAAQSDSGFTRADTIRGSITRERGNMLHTIRHVIGDDARWRRVLRGLNQTFWHQTVTGRQVQDYIRRESGVDLSRVFAQYLTTTQIPVLEYKIDASQLSYRWTNVIPGFDMPVRVTLSDTGYSPIRPTESWQTATLSVNSASGFRVDRNFYVEAKDVGILAAPPTAATDTTQPAERTARRVSGLGPRGPALVLATVLAAAPVVAQQAPSRVARLGWLAGCWQNLRGDYVTEEQWMVPRGGTLFGMSRTVARGRTVEHEFLQVIERDGKLVFIARPSGQPEAEFVEAELSDSMVAYENPSHDFPQRIVYRLQPDGSLAARIEGREGGIRRSVDFPLRRAACR